MITPNLPHPRGITRREMMQVGYSGLLGVGLSSLTAQSATVRSPKPKSVILVFLTGAASHIDTFDPKPDAPVEIRGEFGVVKTPVPGTIISACLPKLAERAGSYALVRTMAHKDNNHTAATHHVITGAIQPNVRFDKPLSREDWPNFGAGLNYLRPRSDGVPTGVTLPTFLQSSDAGLVWPGQHAGFLGPRHDPLQIQADPSKPDFRVNDLQIMAGLDVDTLDSRRSLLSEMTLKQRALAASAEGRRLSEQQEKAFTLLTSGKLSRAFDMDQEKAATRDRYGRHMFGQSLLLSRRLVEAGVPMIQANMGRVQNWDSHSNNFKRLKNDLLPPLDAGVSALLDDLKERGLFDDTLVVVVGDFGRTPKVNLKDGGRDHWAACFSALFAGAGVRGGLVLGKSDATAAYPSTAPFSPDDLGATVYHALGIDPASEIRDRQDRPTPLNRGQVIQPLFTGA